MELVALSDGVYFHRFINFSLLFLVTLNLVFTLFFHKRFFILHKIIWFTTPLLFGILAMMLISGLSLAAMMQFKFSFATIYMMATNIVILILEIKRVKKLRNVRAFPNKLTSYIKYTTLLYIAYILLILSCNIRF